MGRQGVKSKARRAAPYLALVVAVLSLAGAAVALANSQSISDRNHDSKSGIPGFDIKSAKVGYDGRLLRFTVNTYKRLPKGIHPPCIEIRIGTGVGCSGSATVDTTHKSFRCKRKMRAKSVVYSFPAAKLGSPAAIDWRAATIEGKISDAVPNKGYKHFVLHG